MLLHAEGTENNSTWLHRRGSRRTCIKELQTEKHGDFAQTLPFPFLSQRDYDYDLF